VVIKKQLSIIHTSSVFVEGQFCMIPQLFVSELRRNCDSKTREKRKFIRYLGTLGVSRDIGALQQAWEARVNAGKHEGAPINR